MSDWWPEGQSEEEVHARVVQRARAIIARRQACLGAALAIVMVAAGSVAVARGTEGHSTRPGEATFATSPIIAKPHPTPPPRTGTHHLPLSAHRHSHHTSQPAESSQPSALSTPGSAAGGKRHRSPHRGYPIAGPTIDSVSPDSGPLTGGTKVTLSGRDFTDVDQIDFGMWAATDFTVESDTTIVVTAPVSPAPAITAPLLVAIGVTNKWNQGGESGDCSNGSPTVAYCHSGFTYLAVPVVTKVSPALGDSRNKVRISGSGFTPEANVSFGTSAAQVVSETPTSIVVRAPAGQLGSVTVYVETAGGQSAPNPNARYTYL